MPHRYLWLLCGVVACTSPADPPTPLTPAAAVEILTEAYAYHAWQPLTREQHTRDAAGRTTEIRHASWDHDRWEPTHRRRFTFATATDTLPTTETEEAYRLGRWEPLTHTTHHYDPAHHLVETIHAQLLDTTWQPMVREQFTYTEAGQLAEKQVWHWLEGFWDAAQQISYTYTPTETLALHLHADYGTQAHLADSTERLWQYEALTTTTHDAARRPKTVLVQNWTDAGWENDTRTHYQYATDGLPTATTQETWHPFTRTWQPSLHHAFHYDATQRLTERQTEYHTPDSTLRQTRTRYRYGS